MKLARLVLILLAVLPVLYWPKKKETHMTTRDSKLWNYLAIAAVVLAALSRWDLVDPLLPPGAITEKAHALIELLSVIVASVSAKLATSPLPISDKGREAYAGALWRKKKT